MANLASNPKLAQAFVRFGLGGRPDDVAPSDPLVWLGEQLEQADPTPTAAVPSLDEGLALVETVYNSAAGTTAWTNAVTAAEELFLGEIQTLFANAVTTNAPFRERLVLFWTNHFAVMAERIEVMATAGSFVRDAIRPHVTGRFSDMLLAVMHHPAMLYSLDNDQSYGPHSPLAIAWAATGLPPLDINENLGRETLELFTLGSGGGYAQADVDALALLLTGWKVNLQNAPRGFFFDVSQAEPGSQTLLGHSYQATDAGCSAALTALATNPSTYLHLATKLVTHFVSDTPSAADVGLISRVLASSGGNLGLASLALLGLSDAWQPLTKLRAPADLAIAALRATGAAASQIPNMFSALDPIGGLPWRSPFPNGWSDFGADWTGPQQILLRIGWIQAYCASLAAAGAAPKVAATLACSVAPFLTAPTAKAMAAVSSTQDQLTVLFSAPEFQRR